MALNNLLSAQVDGPRITILLGGIVVVLLWRVFAVKLDPNEPPALKSSIPVVGHLIGLVRNAHNYYRILYTETPMAVATLPILNGKLYVVNKPDLINQVFKARTLSFEPYLRRFLVTMTGVSPQGMKIFCNEEFSPKWLRIIYSALMGTPLLNLNVEAVEYIFGQFNKIEGALEVQDFYLYLRNMLTSATTRALMGHDNPFNNQEMIADYWTFENKFPLLYLNFLPRLTASKPFHARTRLTKRYKEYFDARLWLQDSTSTYIRDLWTLGDEWGMTEIDKARLQVGVIHGALSNTIPTAFQYLVNILSRPELVERIREEVAAAAVITISKNEEDSTGSGGGGGGSGGGKGSRRVVTVHLTNLEKNAPLLVSCFKETQRLVSHGTINRIGEEDVILHDADTNRAYLLKKDTPIQCSLKVNSLNAALWGRDALEFDPERYLNAQRESPDDPERNNWLNRGKFSPFGGGKHLCPGRNFAQAENWCMTIALLLGFEVTRRSGGGVLTPPEYTEPPLTAGIGVPVKGSDLGVVIKRRQGWEDVTWRVGA